MEKRKQKIESKNNKQEMETKNKNQSLLFLSWPIIV